jgi:WXG100 family type VII secretion target
MPDPTGVRIAVPTDLADTGPQIISIASQIGDELAALKSQLMPLREAWQGSANMSWQDLQTMWDNAANNLMTTAGTLGSIGTTTGIVWNNYSDVENSNTRTWQH